MFSTTLVAAALSGLVAPGSVAGSPAWQSDYRTALAQSAEQHKPVAVFIARGADGYSRLVAGGIGADAARLLKRDYVCLYVNTGTAGGQELSRSFGMSEGLVISDRTGGVQALRHEGAVSQADLGKYLERFSKTATVAATEQHAAAAAPVAPVSYLQPAFAPTAVYPGFGYGGGCPGGNCSRGVFVGGFGGGCPGGNCRR